MTGAATRPLCMTYDVAVLDLDGVVYIGRDAVPDAIAGISAAQASGMHLAFVTNNAARTPHAVGEHLRALGLEASDADVVTSAQAAVRLVSREIPAGSAVYVIGGPGLHEALVERGLVPVTSLDPGPHGEPVAVVQGYGPEMPWQQVINGAILVREGVPWVASNLDLTVPTERGPGPGNGTLVDLVARFSDRSPVVAGKPRPPLFVETLERVRGERPLVVGDRIDTDIEGALAVGWDSLLVMSGVTTLTHLAALPPHLRPTYIGAHAGCLVLPLAPIDASPAGCSVGGWVARVAAGQLEVAGDGDIHAWWQAVAASLWAHLDSCGQPAATVGVFPGSVAP